MTDFSSFAYGVLGSIVTVIAMKIVDLVLEHFLNKTLFSRIWAAIARAYKKFQTRWNHIVMCFQFRTKYAPRESMKVKEDLTKLMELLSERHRGQMTFSPATWTDTDRMGSVNVTFNQREYRINMHVSSEYRDYEPGEEVFKDTEDATEVSDSVAFSIEVDFPFKSIEPTLLSLSALTNFISEQLADVIPVVEFSKGLFTIAPIKSDLTMDDWIKEKNFDVSLLLKARENIMVNLYPKKAEIVFPTLQIDEKVSEYLKATILNYYL
jgi:hypothetical protein